MQWPNQQERFKGQQQDCLRPTKDAHAAEPAAWRCEGDPRHLQRANGAQAAARSCAGQPLGEIIASPLNINRSVPAQRQHSYASMNRLLPALRRIDIFEPPASAHGRPSHGGIARPPAPVPRPRQSSRWRGRGHRRHPAAQPCGRQRHPASLPAALLRGVPVDSWGAGGVACSAGRRRLPPCPPTPGGLSRAQSSPAHSSAVQYSPGVQSS